VPIDAERVLAAEASVHESAWDGDDVILYHLGIGAGRSLEERELAYVYEERLEVLPTFGVIPSTPAAALALCAPGLDFDPALQLHGEQEIVVHRPLPIRCAARHVARVAALYDKGKAAVAVLEIVTTSLEGETICTNRSSVFLRGAGGFGGDPGPRAAALTPERPADGVIEVPTLPQQALIYRLSVDRNPLHVDPAYARRAGFERPILHGLCTWGMACKALVDELLASETGRVAGWKGRFSGVVFPGETLLVSYSRQGDEVLASIVTAERGEPVLSHGVLSVRD